MSEPQTDDELDACDVLAAIPDDEYTDSWDEQTLLHLFPDREPSDRWEGVFDGGAT